MTYFKVDVDESGKLCKPFPRSELGKADRKRQKSMGFWAPLVRKRLKILNIVCKGSINYLRG